MRTDIEYRIMLLGCSGFHSKSQICTRLRQTDVIRTTESKWEHTKHKLSKINMQYL